PAAHFISYLDERYGMPAVVSFIDDLSYDIDWTRLQIIFKHHMEESLISVLDDYADYPRCSAFSERSHAGACEQAPLAWSGAGVISVDEHLDCLAGDALGPVLDRIWRDYSFEALETGEYGLEVLNGS